MSGSLGFGSNKQDAWSTADASSHSYGYTGATSSDISRSLSNTMAGGQSTSGSESNQTIAFGDLYKQLYEGAGSAASKVAAGAPQLMDTAQQLFTGGSQFLQSLGGNAGTDYQTDRLNGNNPAVDNVIASMKTDAASLFTDQLNPAITARSVAGGTLGGGRQGVAQGIAQGQVADSFTRNAAAVRMQDVSAKDAIAANIAGN